MKNSKLYFQTFGCQMNVADSEYVASLLLNSGNFEITKEIDNADIIIVNTCSVRKHAEDRAESFIGRIKKLKIKNEKLKIIVLGCFAQRAKFELQKKFPFIDIIVGPLDYEYLLEVLQNTFDITLSTNTQHLNLFNKVSTFVPIMTGCNNFCSYCIVPYVRGNEKSRYYEEILNEIKVLLENGAKEITLIGQNVNSYKSFTKNEKKQITFAELLERVANLDSNRKYWVRFLTNHPKDMNYDIVKVIKKYSNISRHIHLPLQSGSNRILQLMNRNYIVEKYKEIIQMIRQEIHGISITTDLIVGFPTETEEDFQATLKAVSEIQFDSTFVFKYSPRKGTTAANFSDDVPKEIKEKRHFELLSLCDEIAKENNKKLLNKTFEVLIVSQNKDKYIAKTITNKTVEINLDNINQVSIGSFLNTKIISTKNHFLIGKI
ncbi:MAG: tRNA (N6-isopentenyl adenosine(37)-C2)-methylthiotransferase MiaB [Endomicrobia bacterium]|nr:tRNA (N6-isopentenyl adenosine(37)-C2)-methylthiotransferase MiaB [Endomicrobiia bacterium]